MSKGFQTNNFDLIRIVTAALVLVNHSLSHLKLTIPFWYTVVQQFQRVPMFFVMSGFLLSASFERNSNLKQYFTNRLSRIYPGLWVCLVITIILYSIVGVDFFNAQTIPWLLAQMSGLIYTPEFLEGFGYGSYNGSLWTIVVELQFYLALPVIYFLYKKYYNKGGNKLFYSLFAFSFLLALGLKLYDAHGITGKAIRYSFLPHAYIFMTGILLQRLKVYDWRIIKGKALYWAAIFLAYSYLLPISSLATMGAMIILACCTISLGYSLPGIATRYLKNRDLSYGVYMYHGMLLGILVEYELFYNAWYMLGVAAATFVLAWLSYMYVEAPAMAWAKRRNAKAQQNVPAREIPEPAKNTEEPVLMEPRPVPALAIRNTTDKHDLKLENVAGGMPG